MNETADRIERVATLLRRVSSAEKADEAGGWSAVEEVLCAFCSMGLILPLLWVVQEGEQEGRMAAQEVMGLIVEFSQQRLRREGWEVSRKGESLGSFVYKHVLTEEECEQPSVPGDHWEDRLLQAVSILREHGVSAEGDDLWAVRVRKESPEANLIVRLAEFVESTAFSPSNEYDVSSCKTRDNSYGQGWSIIDVLKFPADEEVDVKFPEKISRNSKKQEKNFSECLLQDSVTMRQLVPQPWRGPNATPYSEINTSLPPGEAVETWHETTIAGLTAFGLHRGYEERMKKNDECGVAKSSGSTETCDDCVKANLLVLGAGSMSAVINFLLTYHTKRFNIVMVEEDRSLAEASVTLLNNSAKRVIYLDLTTSSHISCMLGPDSSESIFVSSYSSFLDNWNDVLANDGDLDFRFDSVIVGFTGESYDFECQIKTLQLLASWGQVIQVEGVMTDDCKGTELFNIGTVFFFSSFSLVEMTQVETKLPDNCPGNIAPAIITHLSENLPVDVSRWDAMVSKSSGKGTGKCSAHDVDSVVCDLPMSMDVRKAQGTSAVLLPQFISAEEAKSLHQIAGRTAEGGRDWSVAAGGSFKLGREIRSQNSKLWEVLFLQSCGAVIDLMPEFIDRTVEHIIALDSLQNWGFLLAKGNFTLRVCEYHSQVAPSEALPDMYHYDQDSLLTVDIMLSDPLNDFEGGTIQTLEANGELKSHTVHQFDALCFVSHKYHSVTPLLAGRRNVCVLEFWRGSFDPRTCSHRCLSVGTMCKEEVHHGKGGILAEVSDDTNVVLPFKLASVQELPCDRTVNGVMDNNDDCKYIRRGGSLAMLWQASDASDGVMNTIEVAVGSLDKDSVAQLNDMFDDDDSEEDYC